MIIRLAGKNLPVADDNYFPEPKRIKAPTQVKQSAALDKHKDDYGYRIKAKHGQQIALKALDKPITSGKATFTWKMKAVSSPTKNGFLVLSNDPKGNASVVAGSWIGSNNMSIFENISDTWSGSDKSFEANKNGGELVCQAVLDMDDRSVTLTINGVTHKENFSETVPNVGYIGFATQNAETLFTEPEINR